MLCVNIYEKYIRCKEKRRRSGTHSMGQLANNINEHLRAAHSAAVVFRKKPGLHLQVVSHIILVVSAQFPIPIPVQASP